MYVVPWSRRRHRGRLRGNINWISGVCSEPASERGSIGGVFSCSSFGVGVSVDVGDLFCTATNAGDGSGRVTGTGVEIGDVPGCGVATVEGLGD